MDGNRLPLLLPFIASTIIVPHALAQRTTPPPGNAKLMHDVEAVLQNEKAFRGLTIVPRTSRGIVTLTGTVSSEGDKVLAGLEVSNVDGARAENWHSCADALCTNFATRPSRRRSSSNGTLEQRTGRGTH